MGWVHIGKAAYFRSLPRGASYPPDSPFAGGGGRFDDGERSTLYVSTSAAGAVAEFFRSRSSLLPLRDAVTLRLVSIELEVFGPILDVVDPADAATEGIEPARLVSNDADPERRYSECRAFASKVAEDGGAGIKYPCAAHAARPPNVVVFGPQDDGTWVVHGVSDVETIPSIEVKDLVLADRSEI